MKKILIISEQLIENILIAKSLFSSNNDLDIRIVNNFKESTTILENKKIDGVLCDLFFKITSSSFNALKSEEAIDYLINYVFNARSIIKDKINEREYIPFFKFFTEEAIVKQTLQNEVNVIRKRFKELKTLKYSISKISRANAFSNLEQKNDVLINTPLLSPAGFIALKCQIKKIPLVFCSNSFIRDVYVCHQLINFKLIDSQFLLLLKLLKNGRNYKITSSALKYYDNDFILFNNNFLFKSNFVYQNENLKPEKNCYNYGVKVLKDKI